MLVSQIAPTSSPTVRAVLASGKIALLLFIASFGLTVPPPKGQCRGSDYAMSTTLLVAELLRAARRPEHQQQCAPGRRFALWSWA